MVSEKLHKTNTKALETNTSYYICLQAKHNTYCLVFAQLILSKVLLYLSVIVLWKEGGREDEELTKDSLNTHKTR